MFLFLLQSRITFEMACRIFVDLVHEFYHFFAIRTRRSFSLKHELYHLPCELRRKEYVEFNRFTDSMDFIIFLAIFNVSLMKL